MTATIDGFEWEPATAEPADKRRADKAHESITGGDDQHRSNGRFPWIGALPNPRLGPMLVLDDGGYLVPLHTAGDLVRGCRYLWRRGQG